jgi:aldehyde dehydrogenase (NAD+)
MVVQPGKSEIHKDPLGVVLIIAPWNYPFQLMMAPLVGAIAAGNCAVLKPSEVAPATSALFAKFIPRYVDPDCFPVVEGAVKETTELLNEQFDHIFYTGNGSVGRIVMAAAAKHLTPVTLELGGKSPVIVDSTADLDITAKRIVWAKFVNAGQTCVAPDYILVEDRVHDALVHRMVACIREFYGDDPQQSPDFARVVNARHHQRLMKLLGAGEIVAGGKGDEADRYIAPTIIKDVPEDAPVMQDEIFGPILPVLSVPSVDAAMAFINRRPKPLALYLFSSDERTHERVLKRTTSGGVTINHGWLHLGVPDLPFGGVGESGMGAYHGKRSFDVFSHQKAVLAQGHARGPAGHVPALLRVEAEARGAAGLSRQRFRREPGALARMRTSGLLLDVLGGDAHVQVHAGARPRRPERWAARVGGGAWLCPTMVSSASNSFSSLGAPAAASARPSRSVDCSAGGDELRRGGGAELL